MSTGRTLEFTDETEIVFDPTEISNVHLNDLEFVIDVDAEEGEVSTCKIDLHELVQAMVLYSSMEKHRYSWRRSR